MQLLRKLICLFRGALVMYSPGFQKSTYELVSLHRSLASVVISFHAEEGQSAEMLNSDKEVF